MLNLSAFWCYAQTAAALPGAEAILGLQCTASSLQRSCQELHVPDGGSFLPLAGQPLMLLSKGLVISVFYEALYALLFLRLQLHLGAALGCVLCVLSGFSMSFPLPL